MPLYEYICDKCNKPTIKLRKVEERGKETQCEHCGGPAYLAVSGKSLLDFKGIGFYKPGKDVGKK